MRRTAVILLALVVTAAAIPDAAAYVHLGASNNVDLSVQWSRALYDDGAGRTAILVRSDAFADSLAAGALAGFVSAPVLMNPPGTGLDDRIAAELGRLGTDLVRVIGGTAAVSDQTVADLEAAGYEVDRLAGANRLATAVAVMQGVENAEGESIYAGGEVAFLVRAFGDGTSAFADSLGAGMLAGTMGVPLLLTATDSLSTETRDALQAEESLTTVVIIGGTAAVSQSVEDALMTMGFTVERIAGSDRFATAALLADDSFNPDGPGRVTVVDGLNANSWASGYPASAQFGGAVLLSNGATLPEPTASFLESLDGGELFCAPEVAHEACVEADTLLNG